MGGIQGFFKNFGELILGLILIVTISAGIAFVSGKTAQSKYRDFFNFDGQMQEVVPLKDALEQKEEAEKEGTQTDIAIVDSTLEFLGDAKDWTVEQVSDNPLTGAVDGLRQEYVDLRFKMLNFIDKTIYWIVFSITFLFALMVLSKVNKIKEVLKGHTDPAVKENIRMLAEAVNELDQRTSSDKQPQI